MWVIFSDTCSESLFNDNNGSPLYLFLKHILCYADFLSFYMRHWIIPHALENSLYTITSQNVLCTVNYIVYITAFTASLSTIEIVHLKCYIIKKKSEHWKVLLLIIFSLGLLTFSPAPLEYSYDHCCQLNCIVQCESKINQCLRLFLFPATMFYTAALLFRSAAI